MRPVNALVISAVAILHGIHVEAHEAIALRGKEVLSQGAAVTAHDLDAFVKDTTDVRSWNDESTLEERGGGNSFASTVFGSFKKTAESSSHADMVKALSEKIANNSLRLAELPKQNFKAEHLREALGLPENTESHKFFALGDKARATVEKMVADKGLTNELHTLRMYEAVYNNHYNLAPRD